ncbi:NAD(P)-dependent oxidoreductase [Agrobacterium sp. fls2-241-TYG-188a]|uniref:NAD(P)-dependent oxidoreductase n=1 Tax=Agrobacterium sp. fls2-241-TYG-188a TaxID=3040275 RepID=UPI00254C0B7C|nr:NAD(P)-dependent oxidoreductase [Agrobacterium sp. fls2-241-TYG-188a]
MTTDNSRVIAFIGTGLMGGPMAKNLLGAGFSLRVWNRSTEKAQALASEGAVIASSAAEAASGASIVVTMLSDGDAVGDVLFGAGVANALEKGAIIIDSSSIAPSIARAHAKKLEELGLHHIDAPVSGGVVGAKAGTLAIMAGGDEQLIATLSDVFAPMGRLTYVGPSGAGQLCKLANQQIVAITIGAVAEAMMLVEAGGASREGFRNAIRGGFAESRILELHGERMVKRDFEPGGPSKFQLKDLNGVLATAKDLSLDLPLTQKITQEFAEFVHDGGADVDHSGILIYLEKLNSHRA